MLAGDRGRETEDAMDIGIPVRQPALDQPVENTIERNAVDGRGAKCEFDLVVRQRRRRGIQQFHDTNSRWRRARTGTANVSGDSVRTVKIRRGQGIRPKDFERRLNHSHASDATLLQLRQQFNRYGQHEQDTTTRQETCEISSHSISLADVRVRNPFVQDAQSVRAVPGLIRFFAGACVPVKTVGRSPGHRTGRT
jgi:hypothetical protein